MQRDFTILRMVYALAKTIGKHNIANLHCSILRYKTTIGCVNPEGNQAFELEQSYMLPFSGTSSLGGHLNSLYVSLQNGSINMLLC